MTCNGLVRRLTVREQKVLTGSGNLDILKIVSIC